jgi:hypothetical protein
MSHDWQNDWQSWYYDNRYDDEYDSRAAFESEREAKSKLRTHVDPHKIWQIKKSKRPCVKNRETHTTQSLSLFGNCIQHWRHEKKRETPLEPDNEKHTPRNLPTIVLKRRNKFACASLRTTRLIFRTFTEELLSHTFSRLCVTTSTYFRTHHTTCGHCNYPSMKILEHLEFLLRRSVQ